MTQLSLFAPKTTKPAKPLTCAFGTPWEKHFDPPIGVGRDCKACDTPSWERK